MGIYADVAGVPGNLVVQSGPMTVTPGINYFYDVAGTPLSPGDYWVAFTATGGAQLRFDTGGSNTEYRAPFGGGSLPVTFPAGGLDNRNWSIGYSYNTCGIVPTSTPTITPTPSGPVTFIYINTVNACAAAFGCNTTVVQQCRDLNLDIYTCYMIMRICALCGGCQPADIMLLRLTMGWDEICAYYGITWATFTADLQLRMDTLQPEIITPNQIIRGAANDPTAFPQDDPAPNMPNTVTNYTTTLENCSPCP
jgi:hypothetical protein